MISQTCLIASCFRPELVMVAPGCATLEALEAAGDAFEEGTVRNEAVRAPAAAIDNSFARRPLVLVNLICICSRRQICGRRLPARYGSLLRNASPGKVCSGNLR